MTTNRVITCTDFKDGKVLKTVRDWADQGDESNTSGGKHGK